MELCWKVVRGKVVRVTNVDACGAPPAAATAASMAVSDGFIQVSYAAVWESGDDFVQKNADGALCVNSKSPDQFKRYDIKVQFCGVDPELLALMTNAPVEVDALGRTVGFRYGENLDVADFALETWTGVPGVGCGVNSEVVHLYESGTGLTSFTITISGNTTASIDDDATPAQVQAALEALPNIAPGDILVTGTSAPIDMWLFWGGAFEGLNAPTITTTPTGGSALVFAVVRQVGGTEALEEFGYFLLPHVTNGRLMDWTISNGVATFEVSGYTDGNTSWVRGPYNVVTDAASPLGAASSLYDPVVQGDHVLARVTTIVPPTSFCGIQAMPATPTAPYTYTAGG